MTLPVVDHPLLIVPPRQIPGESRSSPMPSVAMQAEYPTHCSSDSSSASAAWSRAQSPPARPDSDLAATSQSSPFAHHRVCSLAPPPSHPAVSARYSSVAHAVDCCVCCEGYVVQIATIVPADRLRRERRFPGHHGWAAPRHHSDPDVLMTERMGCERRAVHRPGCPTLHPLHPSPSLNTSRYRHYPDCPAPATAHASPMSQSWRVEWRFVVFAMWITIAHHSAGRTRSIPATLQSHALATAIEVLGARLVGVDGGARRPAV